MLTPEASGSRAWGGVVRKRALAGLPYGGGALSSLQFIQSGPQSSQEERHHLASQVLLPAGTRTPAL